MLSTTKPGLFADANGSKTASTNPLLKCHYPHSRQEFNQTLARVLYPLGISPYRDAHMQHVRNALKLNRGTILLDITPASNGDGLTVSFEVSALANAFMYTTELEKILGCKPSSNTISSGITDTTSCITLIYDKSALPHFIQWCHHSVKALDEEELQNLRKLSENDTALQNYKSTFAERINRKLIKLERELIIEGGKDILIGQLLTARTALVPTINRLEQFEELELTEEQQPEFAKLMESFKLAIKVVSSEEDLRNRDTAQLILQEVDEYCANKVTTASQASNITSTSPTIGL